MSENRRRIFDPGLTINVLRSQGYKSTATAVAELIDNSIEANAKDIDILAISEKIMVGRTSSQRVTKIGVLDNGDGMPIEILENSLGFGKGTRLGDKAISLGKYGWGLKGSSISQGRRVEVYSWQNINWEGKDVQKEEVNMLSLDVDKVDEDDTNELDKVVKTTLPKDVVSNFGYKIKKHPSGTLVFWLSLDQLKFKRVISLVNSLNTELCRLYRFFINGIDYGDKRNISIQDINPNGVIETKLHANDPMYLMKPNNLPGYETESTNELVDSFEVPVKFINQAGETHSSKYEIVLSVAKPEIQKLGGNSIVGKHYGKNSGISFIRAGREVGFGNYRYTSASEPRDRWWGMEVRFGPELDQLFGVSMDKQKVDNVHKISDDFTEGLFEEEEFDLSDTFRIELSKLISGHISELSRTVESRGEGKLKDKKIEVSVKDQVNEEFKKQKTKTASKGHGENLDDEEKIKEIMGVLQEHDTSLDDETTRGIAEHMIDYEVDILTRDWDGFGFLGLKLVGKAAIGQINRNHPFYEKFWKRLRDDKDQRGFRALTIILMALIRAEDEMQAMMDENNKKTFARFREKWGSHIDTLMDKAGD